MPFFNSESCTHWALVAALYLPLLGLAGCIVCKPAPHSKVAQNPAAQNGQEKVLAPAVRPVSHTAELIESSHATVAPTMSPGSLSDDAIFDGESALDAERLVALVEARNPTLDSLEAAWRAAAARFPQAIALDDPMFDVMLAPGSFSSNSNVQDSWAFEVGQKFPWPGKRALRGRAANANARGALLDARDYRVELAMLVRLALAEYALSERLLELNEAEQKLADELRSIAEIKYETNQAPQQESLQAALAAADARKQKIGIDRRRATAVARINAMLHRHPAAPLPAPAEGDSDDAPADDLDLLVAIAERGRPDLAAQAARIRAARAEYCLAVAEFKPDFEVYGRYDAFWVDPEQQGSVGVRLNVPLQRERRRAAVREARARESQARHEYEARVAKVRYDVQAARAAFVEANSLVLLYRDEILPLAERNAASARAAYETGGVTILAALSAQREWLAVRREQIESAANRERSLAELSRAVGGELPSDGAKN